jgi:hypothetical protein
MFLKRRPRTQDGKIHSHYSVCASLRVSRERVVQRQVLHLGELNTTQIERVVADWRWEPVGRALMSLRGLAVLSASTLVAELAGLVWTIGRMIPGRQRPQTRAGGPRAPAAPAP